MRNLAITVLVANCFAVNLTPARADESSQQCNANRARHFIGAYLTQSVKTQARIAAGAVRVVVNPVPQDFEPNRLRITTDLNLVITRLECY